MIPAAANFLAYCTSRGHTTSCGLTTHGVLAIFFFILFAAMLALGLIGMVGRGR